VYRLQVTGTELTGPVQLTLPVPVLPATGVRAGPDVAMLAYYDASTGRWRPVRAVYHPASHTISAASGHLSVWTVLRLSATFRVGGDGVVDSLSFSPDSKTLAVAANTNGTVGLWNVAARHLNATLRSGTRFGIDSVAFSPDGKTLAMGTAYEGSQLWNTASRRLVARLPVSNSATVYSVAFSPDGKRLAVATSVGTTQLWDVARPGQIVASITTDGEDWSAVFSPDSTVLAIGTGEHIQLWDAATDQKISSLPFTIDQAGDPTTDARQLAFSPDGMFLAAGTSGGEVQLWSTPFVGDTFAYLCAQAGQPFPRGEWAQLAPGVPYQETCH
jgi:WD40 repeat protein